MKKLRLLILALFLFCAACSGKSENLSAPAESGDGDRAAMETISSGGEITRPQVSPKVDNFINFSAGFDKKISPSKGAGGISNAKNLVSVFIKSSDVESTKKKLQEIGGKVGSTVGDIITVTLSVDAVESAGKWPEVVYVEVSKPISFQNDISLEETGVGSIHLSRDEVGEDGLPVANQDNDGRGIIIGIIDTGIDLSHPAFFDEDGKSRVLFVWDQQQDWVEGDDPVYRVDNPSFSYGTECKTQTILDGQCNSLDTNGHGTHVAGIAAGRDPLYGGVAPASSLIVVKYREATDLIDNVLGITFSASICDAAYYIFQKAAALRMPAVINISSGSAVGPHDNSSLFEGCLNNLVASGTGRAIVVSAGNSGKIAGGTHIGYPITGSKRGSFLNPKRYNAIYYTDIWENSDCNTRIDVGLWNHNDDGSDSLIFRTNQAGRGESLVKGDDSRASIHIGRSGNPNPENSRFHSYVAIVPGADFNFLSNYFDVTFSNADPASAPCSGFDAWVDADTTQEFDSKTATLNGIEYLPGDNKSTVMIPSTAANIISVGSYNTKTVWEDFLGNPQIFEVFGALGDISSFSSRGPAINTIQGQKPNIMAPGAWIVSALSLDATIPDQIKIDALHQAMPGTSMSSPHIAGVAALMLETNPLLSYRNIIDILQTGARSIENTPKPNSDWGYGKVNAQASLELAENFVPLEEKKETLIAKTQAAPARTNTIDTRKINTPNEIKTEDNAVSSSSGNAESDINKAEGGGGGCSLIINH